MRNTRSATSSVIERNSSLRCCIVISPRSTTWLSRIFMFTS